MSKTGISGITDYSSLYSAYSRLKSEGDRTSSAANAKKIFGQNVDIDGDNTAELWELMQRANEAHNRIIFDTIEFLKKVQNGKYPHISEDNPIHIVLSIEGEIAGDEKVANAYSVINEIIRAAKESIKDDESPKDKLWGLNVVIEMLFDIPQRELLLLSEGLAGSDKSVDCDTGSFIYLAVAHELKWPLYLVDVPGHAFVIWRQTGANPLCFETTSGEVKGSRYRGLNKQKVDITVTNAKNNLFGIVNYNCAMANLTMGKYEHAIKYCTRAIELKPGFADAYCSRGDSFYQLGKYDLALKDINRAIEIDPKYAGAFHARSLVYDKLGNSELADKDRIMYRKLKG